MLYLGQYCRFLFIVDFSSKLAEIEPFAKWGYPNLHKMALATVIISNSIDQDSLSVVERAKFIISVNIVKFTFSSMYFQLEISPI